MYKIWKKNIKYALTNREDRLLYKRYSSIVASRIKVPRLFKTYFNPSFSTLKLSNSPVVIKNVAIA